MTLYTKPVSLEENESILPDNDLSERRTDRRRRVLKRANIYFNQGYAGFDCVVRNLTNKGALIDLDNNVGLPSSFLLHINGEECKYPTQIEWRNSKQAGLSFQ